jgi:hypothetical protein
MNKPEECIAIGTLNIFHRVNRNSIPGTFGSDTQSRKFRPKIGLIPGLNGKWLIFHSDCPKEVRFGRS